MTDPEIQGATVADAVAVAYVHDHEVATCWHHSLIELLAYDLAGAGRVFRGGWVAVRYGTDGLIEGRNMAVRTFLGERKAEWLWWIDTDMGFRPDVVDRLMDAADPVERPMVGALCFTQRELHGDGLGGWRTAPAPTIFDFGQVDGQTGYAVRWDYERQALNRCAGTGSACVLIHRSVFERVQERYGTWYNRVPNPGTGQLISEDLSFCTRVGALNIPIHVDARVEASHAKQVWLIEEDYIRDRMVETVLARRQQGAAPEAPGASASAPDLVEQARERALAKLTRPMGVR